MLDTQWILDILDIQWILSINMIATYQNIDICKQGTMTFDIFVVLENIV